MATSNQHGTLVNEVLLNKDIFSYVLDFMRLDALHHVQYLSKATRRDVFARAIRRCTYFNSRGPIKVAQEPIRIRNMKDLEHFLTLHKEDWPNSLLDDTRYPVDGCFLFWYELRIEIAGDRILETVTFPKRLYHYRHVVLKMHLTFKDAYERARHLDQYSLTSVRNNGEREQLNYTHTKWSNFTSRHITFNA